jgi:hypothetical protein
VDEESSGSATPSAVTGAEFARLLENELLGEVDSLEAEEFLRSFRESAATED